MAAAAYPNHLNTEKWGSMSLKFRSDEICSTDSNLDFSSLDFQLSL